MIAGSHEILNFCSSSFVFFFLFFVFLSTKQHFSSSNKRISLLSFWCFHPESADQRCSSSVFPFPRVSSLVSWRLPRTFSSIQRHRRLCCPSAQIHHCVHQNAWFETTPRNPPLPNGWSLLLSKGVTLTTEARRAEQANANNDTCCPVACQWVFTQHARNIKRLAGSFECVLCINWAYVCWGESRNGT